MSRASGTLQVGGLYTAVFSSGKRQLLNDCMNCLSAKSITEREVKARREKTAASTIRPPFPVRIAAQTLGCHIELPSEAVPKKGWIGQADGDCKLCP